MDERITLLTRLDAAREKMKQVVAQTSEEQYIYPPWRMKEILDHIAGWDDAVIASLKAHMDDLEPATPAALGINPYNAATVTSREAIPYARTLREWEVSRETLKKLINEMPEGKFQQAFVFPWGDEGSVANLVEIFIEHEEEHAREIRAILGKADD
jgi:hypothetical protein